MEFKLYIHGVPNGYMYYPTDGGRDIDYLQTFYANNNSVHVTRFLRIQRFNQKWFYTYVVKGLYERVPNNASSYFAMTLCSEQLACDRVTRLYYVFEETYKRAAAEQFIIQSKYNIGSFDGVYNSVRNDFNQSLQRYLRNSNWVQYPVNANYNDSLTKQHNLNDTTDSNLFTNDFLSFTTDVSPEFPTIEERIKSAGSSATIDPSRQEQTNLKTQIDQKDAEIISLKNEKDELQGKVDQYTNVFTEVKRLTEGFPSSTPPPPDHNTAKQKTISEYIPLFNTLLLIALCVISFFVLPRDNTNNRQLPDNKLQELYNSVQEIKQHYSESNTPETGVGTNTAQPATQDTNNRAPERNKKKYRIDIAEISQGKSLEVGKIYTLRCMVKYEGAGKEQPESNVQFISNNNDVATISGNKMTIKKEGTVTITCKKDGINVPPRTENIKSQSTPPTDLSTPVAEKKK